MSKKSFENLTIVSVTTSTNDLQSTLCAIERSCEELKGAKGLLICPALPDDFTLPAGIAYKQIAEFGQIEYYLFMIYQLDFFIETDYCLIVQPDGWVLDGSKWREEFWDYDYIGAPMPMLFYRNEKGEPTIISGDDFAHNIALMNTPSMVNPQEGIFSLRSKKLLGMPRKLNLDYYVHPPLPPNVLSPHKLNLSVIFFYENLFISALLRLMLEENGIRFAPNDVAFHFSTSNQALRQLCNQPIGETLGGYFPGEIKLIERNKIALDIYGENAPKNYDELRQAEPRINWFISMHYAMDIHLHPLRAK